MKFDLDRLMENMIDMHCHVQNDTSNDPLQTVTTESLIQSCPAGIMHGIVLKSHGWPAVRLAKKLDGMVEDFRVYLNHLAF